MRIDPNSDLGRAIQKAIDEGRATVGKPAALPAPAADLVKPKPKRKPKPLLPGAFKPPATWVVPLYVCAADNQSIFNRGKLARAGHERTACTREFAKRHDVWHTFATLIAVGSTVRVELTRIGGRQMDASNVVSALKWVQDVCAAWLGVDDACPFIDWKYGQQPGGRYGVRVSLEGLPPRKS